MTSYIENSETERNDERRPKKDREIETLSRKLCFTSFHPLCHEVTLFAKYLLVGSGTR